MIQAILYGVVVFFCGWGIAFFVSLARAPALLDAECQQVIKRLSDELELPDQALATYLADLLSQVGNDGFELLRFMLLHDEIGLTLIKVKGLSANQVSEAVRLCTVVGLLKYRVETSEKFSQVVFRKFFYRVPPEYRQTLKRLLYKTIAIPLPLSAP